MTTNEDVKQAMREVDPPVVSPGYLAEHVEVGRERCRQILRDLEDDGLVTSEKVGSSNLYYITDDGFQVLADELRARLGD